MFLPRFRIPASAPSPKRCEHPSRPCPVDGNKPWCSSGGLETSALASMNNEKNPWLFIVYRGWCYPTIWGLFHKPWNKDPYESTQCNDFIPYNSNDQRTSDIAGLLLPNESYLILHAVDCWLLSANSVACSPWKKISCNLAMWKKGACITNIQEQYLPRVSTGFCLFQHDTDLASFTERHLKSLVFASFTKQICAYFSGPLAWPLARAQRLLARQAVEPWYGTVYLKPKWGSMF